MNPPVRPLRTELNEALVGGIRKRGPDAFGSMLDALVRLAVGVVTFLLLFGLGQLAGYQVTSIDTYAGMGTISGLVSWLAMRHPKDADPDDENSSRRQGTDFGRGE